MDCCVGAIIHTLRSLSIVSEQFIPIPYTWEDRFNKIKFDSTLFAHQINCNRGEYK